MKKELSRRSFLRLSALAAVGSMAGLFGFSKVAWAGDPPPFGDPAVDSVALLISPEQARVKLLLPVSPATARPGDLVEVDQWSNQSATILGVDGDKVRILWTAVEDGRAQPMDGYMGPESLKKPFYPNHESLLRLPAVRNFGANVVTIDGTPARRSCERRPWSAGGP